MQFKKNSKNIKIKSKSEYLQLFFHFKYVSINYLDYLSHYILLLEGSSIHISTYESSLFEKKINR